MIRRRNRKYLWMALAIAAVMLLALAAIYAFQVTRMVRADRPQLPGMELKETYEAIELTQQEIIVAESAGAELRVVPSPLSIIYYDKETDISWPLQSLNDNAPDADRSLMDIEFLSEDGELHRWNIYSYSTASDNFDLHAIENGIRITFYVSQGASTRFDDYMPRRISEERFESIFVEGLAALIDSGELTGNEATIFPLALNTAYSHEKNEGYYFLNYVGAPPNSTTRRLIEISERLGYTYEDLVQDNEEFGVLMETRETPEFRIPLEISLDSDDLIARVPAAQIESLNNAYYIQNLQVLPNFLSADGTLYETGAMLVPDGSGALINFNEASTASPSYARQFRNSDYFAEYYRAPVYSEDLTMPLFGMIFGGQSVEDAEGETAPEENGQKLPNERAALAIIEDGSVLAGLRAEQANLSGDAAASRYNRIFPNVDITQFARTNVDGPYAQGDTLYMVTTGMQELNFQVRYKTFGEDTDYYDLAESYREYLAASAGSRNSSLSDDLTAHLQVLGTVDLERRILGVPYASRFAMTEYEELTEILHELDREDLLLTYLGAFKGGYNQDVLLSTSKERTNGSEEEWEGLLDTAVRYNTRLSLMANLTRADETSVNLSPRMHAITDYDNLNAYVYEYDQSDGRFSPSSFNYVRITPWYFASIADKFLAGEKNTPLLTVADLGTDFYADYDRDRGMSGYEADQIVTETMSRLAGEYDLVMEDAFLSLDTTASFLSSISRESSEYASFSETIPFRQLVLNNYLPFSTKPINVSALPPEHFVLYAAEVGAIPEFLISAKSSELLKEAQYRGFYSTEFSQHKDDMNVILEEVQGIKDSIGTKVLSDHEVIANKVYLSTYENGTQVVVNYSDLPAEFNGQTVDSLGYLIIEGD